MTPTLDHVSVWIFDLDNTLYPAACNLFDQVDRRMGAFIANLLDVDPSEARRIQKRYYREHGTTLRGLMDNHDIEPQEFLSFVHDIDHSPVPPSPALDAALGRLDGRKLVFTNGTVHHAGRVLDRLGVAHHFEAVFDILDAGYVPKPEPSVYAQLIERHAIDPGTAILVEDIARNLEPAAALGMTTLWVRTESEFAGDGATADFVHHVTDDLVAWLTALVERREAG